eukprot:9488330-Pyramimonas_sp.AAC.1
MDQLETIRVGHQRMGSRRKAIGCMLQGYFMADCMLQGYFMAGEGAHISVPAGAHHCLQPGMALSRDGWPQVGVRHCHRHLQLPQDRNHKHYSLARTHGHTVKRCHITRARRWESTRTRAVLKRDEGEVEFFAGKTAYQGLNRQLSSSALLRASVQKRGRLKFSGGNKSH